MCLLAIQYRLVPEAPILVAANREEFYERATSPPAIQPGKPRVLCAIDQRHGGTFLGVNQNGLLVGVCNRSKLKTPVEPRSRGLLCRDLLRAHSARKAVDQAMDELSSGNYDGANFLIVDPDSGWVVHGGDDPSVVRIQEGLSIIASGDVNDPLDERVALARRLLTLQTLDSPVKFLAVASKAFARPSSGQGRAGMVLRGAERGTVSSTLIGLGKKPRDATYQYANGSPDRTSYADYAPLLRDILSRGLREGKTMKVKG